MKGKWSASDDTPILVFQLLGPAARGVTDLVVTHRGGAEGVSPMAVFVMQRNIGVDTADFVVGAAVASQVP